MAVTKKAKDAWRERGFDDGYAGRPQRAPLRDDAGVAYDAYITGYRLGSRERTRDAA